MRLGILIEETWDFFQEIYTELSKHHQTSLFKRRELQLPIFRERVNRYMFHSDIQSFMRANDVVFFEWASGLLATGTHFSKRCGIVTRLHRYEMYQWAERINWSVVDRVILVSQAKQREFNMRFPGYAHKSIVVSPSTSLIKFSPRPRRFEGDIGILCHLTPRKRVYELILAFYELTKKRDYLRLHIAGGQDPAYEDYYSTLQYIVRKLGLQDKVIFYGHITETWDWYHRIDIFISNSYSEGLQVAPMEAMASGCYCLAHCWDGADELLPEENLFFTNGELQEKILNYCDILESERQRIREHMRTLAVEKFDINQTKTQIRQILEEVGAISYEKKVNR